MKTTEYILREEFTTIHGRKIRQNVATYNLKVEANSCFDSLTKNNPTHKVTLVKITETIIRR